MRRIPEDLKPLLLRENCWSIQRLSYGTGHRPPWHSQKATPPRTKSRGGRREHPGARQAGSPTHSRDLGGLGTSFTDLRISSGPSISIRSGSSKTVENTLSPEGPPCPLALACLSKNSIVSDNPSTNALLTHTRSNLSSRDHQAEHKPQRARPSPPESTAGMRRTFLCPSPWIFHDPWTYLCSPDSTDRIEPAGEVSRADSLTGLGECSSCSFSQ